MFYSAVCEESLSPVCPSSNLFSLYCAYSMESSKEANYSFKEANPRSKDTNFI